MVRIVEDRAGFRWTLGWLASMLCVRCVFAVSSTLNTYVSGHVGGDRSKFGARAACQAFVRHAIRQQGAVDDRDHTADKAAMRMK